MMIQLLNRRLALALLLAACTACSGDPNVTKQKYLESGNRYFEQKKFREAIVEYRNAIKIDPRFGEARLKLAASYLQTGDPVNGLREQVRAADLLPDNVDAQVDAGNLLLLAGRFEDAKARATQALEKQPANVRAQVLLGNTLAGLKDFDAAIDEVEEALKLDPDRMSTYANLGTIQLASGNRAAAEETFKRALARNPTSLQAQLGLANFYWTVGQLPEAEALLEKAVAAAPTDARANRALANLYLATKRAAKAEPFLVAVTTADPSSVSRLMLADYYLAMGRTQEAVPLLKTVVDDPQWSARARVRLAGIDLRAGRTEDAERLVEQVLKSSGSDTQALLLKATIQVSRKKLDDAVRTVDTAINANPRSAQAHFARGRLALMQQRPEDAKNAFAETVRLNPRAAEAQIELAKLHLASGAVTTSVDLAAQAAKNDPGSMEARLVLARGYLAQRDVTRAEGVLAELVATYPKNAGPRTQLGFLLGLKGDRAGAAQRFQEALALDPDYLDATTGLVSLDLSARQFDKARARVEERLKRTPNDSGAQLLAGRTYAAIGDSTNAEIHLRKALEADPANLDAYESLGKFYVAMKRLPEARKEFEALASRQSRPVAALTMVAMIQESMGEAADAQRTYEKVLQINPDAAVAANNLAWIYVERGQNLDLALQLARVAKAKLPKRVEVADTLGWIYYHKGLLSLAIREFEDCVKNDPTNPLYHFHLGLAFAKNGNRESAKKSLETALRLKPNFDGAVEATRVLATL